MAATSRTIVTISMSATLAELRDMIREADRLGAPDDARVTNRTALGGLVSGLAIEWTSVPAVEPAVSTGPEICPCVGVEAAEPVKLNANLMRDSYLGVAYGDRPTTAEDEQPNITVVNLDPDLVRRVCAETNLGTFQ